VSEPDHGRSSDAVEEDASPLQRALDLFVFAPVGIALTVAEDLPGLIGKGHQRFETDVQNARIIGRIVVTQGQRQLLARVGQLLHRTSDGTDGTSDSSAPTDGAGGAPGVSAPASARPLPSTKPSADPADGAIVDSALAGYDTLSASQVVRRLESLGPDELRALSRHEASHRNRHTILNRAHQILEAIEFADEAVPPLGTVAESAAPGGAVSESAAPGGAVSESAVSDSVMPATPPPETAAPDLDRSGE